MAEDWPQQIEWQSWHWPYQAARMSFVSCCLCSCCPSWSKIGWAASFVVSVCSHSSLSTIHCSLWVTEREFWRIKYHDFCCPVFIEVIAQGHYFNDAQIFLISLLSYFFTFLHSVCHIARERSCFLPIPKGLLIFVEKGLGSEGTLIFLKLGTGQLHLKVFHL